MCPSMGETNRRGQICVTVSSETSNGVDAFLLLVPASSPKMPPTFIRPCLPSPVDTPPDGSEWTHEVKFDGYRTLAAVGEDGSLRIWSRSGRSLREYFPGIAEDVLSMRRTLFIDGEAVLFRGDGTTDRLNLRNRFERDRVALVAFDILFLDGEDLRMRPLVERKKRLMDLLFPGYPRIQFCEGIDGDGTSLFQRACELGLEGIVSKLKTSIYRSGRSRNWLKAKCPDYL